MKTMTYFKRIPQLAILFCALTTSQAHAAEERVQEKFVIGVENIRYEPLYSNDNGHYSGASRELLDAFAKDAGIEIEYHPLPVARLHASFLAGELDFKFPANPYWQAERKKGKKITYSDRVFAYIDGTLVKPERKGLGATNVKNLGSVAGFTPWNWREQVASGEVTLKENANFSALIRQTIFGRIDAAYASVAVVNYQLDNVLKQPGALVFDPDLPHSKDYYFLSTMKHDAVIKTFNEWLTANEELVADIKERNHVEKWE